MKQDRYFTLNVFASIAGGWKLGEEPGTVTPPPEGPYIILKGSEYQGSKGITYDSIEVVDKR